MDSKQFSHSGKVVSIKGNMLKVEFESQSACGGCSARAKCGMVDSSRREVEVVAKNGDSYSVGDTVQVTITHQMGIFSVIVAYIIPLIILIAILSGAVYAGLSEGVAALLSLGMVAVYYGVVYLMRSKLDKQIKFTIEK